MDTNKTQNPQTTAQKISEWAKALGFQSVGITTPALGRDELRLREWLRRGYHGEMHYMARHGSRRSRPAELIPGTLRVISVRMNYLPPAAKTANEALADPASAYVSRYALGRDYHKLMRKRLKRLAEQISAEIGPMGYRVFSDSAPVMEKALARDAGLGWIGKHTLVLNRHAGSYFFLGEIYVDMPLPPRRAGSSADLCGSCSRCIQACPTGAIRGPYQLDARRCISYLTIELRGSIPEPLRPLIGNRIFGCDDCQLACPWNRYAHMTTETDFSPRHQLDNARLVDLFAWSEDEFNQRTAGMALRRTGYAGWLRNVAIALGNAPAGREFVHALQARADHPSPVVREHVTWALALQREKTTTGNQE